MIVWMLYSALVALVVAAAARAAEWVGRLAGYRVRWIWAGAFALTVFLSGSAALRNVATDGTAPVTSRAVDRRATPLRGAVQTMDRALSPAANGYAASLAVMMSIGLALVVIGVGRRLRRSRAAWPRAAMQGVDVCIAPSIGPLVIGFLRPEIVVPRWLLARDADDQRLVVAHEYEHVRARDPLLLGLAWAAVVAAPWSPALWYMLSRLRLAVELDCDARVLRRGAAPQSYGSLLIDVAQQASVLQLSALALADDSSHLHQRILAMQPQSPRFARVRASLAGVFALSAVLVACRATLPTDAEITPMNVTTSMAVKAHFAGRILIDGILSTESQMKALDRASIESVEIQKGAAAAEFYHDPEAAKGVIVITTKRGSAK